MSSSISPPGSCIGKYRILAHVATGGMGAVYKAHDEKLDRTVALKVISPDLAENPNLIERFRREAMHAARLSHKNIVSLYEYGQADGYSYLAMEFIEGMDLADYIRRRGKLDPDEALRILRQACQALDHAFAQGITHRDIKPSNFLLAITAGRCRVKLTDLGLARMVSEDEYRLTRDGSTVGTVDYMPPEQARDSRLADVRSDIYSLGCTFYHMLAGHPPFNEGGVGQRIYQHLAANPADVRTFNPRVSAPVWAILRRMLAKRPEDRFQTPGELLDVVLVLLGLTPASKAPAGMADVDSELEPDPEPEPPPAPAPPRRPEPSVRPPSPPPAPARRPVRQDAPAPPHKKRDTSFPEFKTVSEETPDLPGVTPEQRSTAAAQFHHATEVIRAGDRDYALQLLLSSCKLDPANLLYRKVLREVGREAASGKHGGWLGSLTNLPARGRMRAARHAGDHRKALEHGEEFLTRVPGDVSTQLEMADSARLLGLGGLAVWLLEEARQQAPKDKKVLLALARLFELQDRLPQAISVWEQIQAQYPTDQEAADKLRDLSARDTIARTRRR